jgi:RNA ligase (TIGR02306 family)
MLASIQRISKIMPIPGADKIERVSVLGWDCVVKKGLFKEGDLCIYVEIDTMIPQCFLSEKYDDRKTYIRLQTVKLKGQISQGLVLPLNHLGCSLLHTDNLDEYTDVICNSDIGTDLTEFLKVKKYEKAIPIQLSGMAKGSFPSFLVKTDEVKIQSAPELLEKMNCKPYYITSKLDGTSFTCYKYEGKFGVCSRNLELKEGGSVYWKIAREYNLMDMPDGHFIQGEIVGENIQGNPLKIKGHDLFVFNIGYIKGNVRLPYPYMLSWKEILDIKLVPVLEMGENFKYTMEEIIRKAEGNYPSGNLQEGIVVRSLDQKISFKVLNNNFLLKKEE